ncbi:MAG: hypothetical protein H6602_01355 [Flavobacteriales bacterium]|nr:hypothetical protein [Flavobacteriales bacterium]
MKDSLKNLAENALSKVDRTALDELFEFGKLSMGENSGQWVSGRRLEPGVHTAPYYSMSDVARKIMRLLYQLELIVPFDWSSWDEGRKLLESNDLSKLDGQPKHVLIGLLTALARNDRFCEGAWGAAIEDGTVGKLILELEKKVVDA